MKAARTQTPGFDVSAIRQPARAPTWVVPSVKLALLIADLSLTVAAFIIAFSFRQRAPLLQASTHSSTWSNAFAPYGALLILIVPIRIISMAYSDLYRLRGEFSFVED